MELERKRFPDAPEHALLRRALLAQDGSTTRLCAAFADGPLELRIHAQQRTADVPAAVRECLGGTAWLERVTSLHAKNSVLMDNLSFTRLDTVPEWFLQELDRGAAPIGRLLEQLFVRRERSPSTPEIEARLWNLVGLPDPSACRAYRVLAPQAPLMYIFEAFRGGLTGNSA